QRRASEKLGEIAPLLAERSQELQHASDDLREARRLGDQGVERDLSELWAGAMALLWRQEAENLSLPENGAGGAPVANPLQGSLDALQKALVPFASITQEAVLKEAAALVAARPKEAAALAGAADVIAFLTA